tara:strand:- start:190 stop:519 length:330 start_codon:yes stop_codon:yes gene_type:complete
VTFSAAFKLAAEHIEWAEVSKINNEFLFIDPNSLKYNNKGILSTSTKYVEINQEDNKIINTYSYIMAIDCEKRLFSKLPSNAELKQVKKWENPINNKLIKKAIVNSCSY